MVDIHMTTWCQLVLPGAYVFMHMDIWWTYIWWTNIRLPCAIWCSLVLAYALPFSYQFTQCRSPARFYLDPATPTLASSATCGGKILKFSGFSDSQALC